MFERENIKNIFLQNKDKIKDFILEKKYKTLIGFLHLIEKDFRMEKTKYDRSLITPYDNSVSKFYGLKCYVNASFISYENRNYIAAQLPVEENKNDFIKLLTKVELVVSCVDNCTYLEETNLIERKPVYFDNVLSFYDESYNIDDYIIRRLRILNWKDHDVLPNNELDHFHQYFCTQKSSLVLVHCLMGVGRTGFLIMYDILQSYKKVDLETFVNILIELRSCRSGLVFSETQMRSLVNMFVS